MGQISTISQSEPLRKDLRCHKDESPLEHDYNQLPFHNCTEYEIQDNCTNNNKNFLKLLEDNNLSKQIVSRTTNILKNFKCTYENENSFHKVVNSHNQKALKIIHLNIRSINKHKILLKTYLEDLKCTFDLIVLSETGNAKVQEIEDIFQNYKFYIDPPKTGKGSKGGVGILVNKYSFNQIEEMCDNNCLKKYCNCSNCLIENKWLKLTSNNKTYILGSIYRHPNGNMKHFTEGLSNILSKMDKKATCILAGDINIDLLKQQNKNVDMYLETLMEHNFQPYICIPTRITEHTATVIDHINVRIPTNQMLTKISSGNLINDISDHLPNFFIMDCDINKTKERPLIRLYNEKTIKNFEKNIKDEPPILPHPRSSDPNILLTEFTYNCNRILDKYFPLVKMSRKKFKEKEYITKEVREMIKQRNKLHKIYINNKNDENKENWREMRNKTDQAIKNCEIKHYQDLIKEHGNNCQAMWKTLSHIIGSKNKKQTTINTLNVNQKKLTNQLEITEGLNEFLSNAGENLASEFDDIKENEFYRYLNAPVNQSFYIHKIETKEVSTQIANLENKKSAGHDGLTNKFLKLSLCYLIRPLTDIYNTSISTGIYPDELKVAKCVPIFKKGKKDDPSNYRPISILSSINKVFEKLLYQRLYEHFTKLNILYEFQYGFRQNHSTTQALIEIIDYLGSSIDEGKQICGIFLDLTKAFDTVDHDILLKKLHFYGIRGVSNTLLKSYLTNRCQYVSLICVK